MCLREPNASPRPAAQALAVSIDQDLAPMLANKVLQLSIAAGRASRSL